MVVDPDLYDLNRVEVLRGPQGTLYGSGSMGGTVKLVTNAPQLNEFEGSAEVIGSGTDGGGFNRGGNLMLNVPLVTNALALRVVLTDKYTDGWINRVVLGGSISRPDQSGTLRRRLARLHARRCDRGDAGAVVPRVNWERLEGGRASLLWQPNEALKINATRHVSENRPGRLQPVRLAAGNTRRALPAVQPGRARLR